MRRVKTIQESQFEDIFERHWEPVQLGEDALPGFIRGIPEHIFYCALASGESISSVLYSSDSIPSGRQVGGIEVYRRSPDDPVALNKDCYAVVASPSTVRVLLIDGPIKDKEHWLNEIPDRYAGVEIIGSSKRSKS